MKNFSLAQVSKENSHKFINPDQNASIDSELLFINGDVLFIQHRGEQYRLRRTYNGKLILTK